MLETETKVGLRRIDTIRVSRCERNANSKHIIAFLIQGTNGVHKKSIANEEPPSSSQPTPESRTQIGTILTSVRSCPSPNDGWLPRLVSDRGQADS